MANVAIHIEDWKRLPWKKFQRNVFRLQKRIYQASRRDDRQRVHNLQRLLLRSWSARCLAVRQVTQDNRGKHTPGVDGVASLTPQQRLRLADRLRHLRLWIVQLIRRVYIPKPGNPTEQRGLGIPVMADRACQALVKLALEPEWEAKFEPNSYGFRPGRSTHDAIEAIFNTICRKPKFVYDADIAKCFDRIAWKALLDKLNAIPLIQRLVGDWLRAGILDNGQWLFPEAGTPQGGVISPLLANIALHGLETAVVAVSQRHRITVIRYADDFVILCQDLETLKQAIAVAHTWLAGMGLEIKASKTRLTHTLNAYDGTVGFDFLGFNVRQYPVGQYRTRTYSGQPGYKTIIKPNTKGVKRHSEATRDTTRQYVGASQAALIAQLNPKIRGWTLYYRASVAKRLFSKLDTHMHSKLVRWAKRRHSHKCRAWCYHRYWRRQGTRTNFSDGTLTLINYADMPITRHVKVKGDKSPYDGDWVYWGERLGKDPTRPLRVTRLLKLQQGRCECCGLRLMTEDVIEVHHQDSNRNNNRYTNLALLHAHCHDRRHGAGIHDNDLRTEEPDEVKVSRPVL
jgi:RNA-directed DNA polymerase